MAEKATTAPPLTVDNVLTAVRGVEWRALGKALLYGILTYHEIVVKLKVIEQKYKSADVRLRMVVETWMHHCRIPSWRHLIWSLDDGGMTRVADNIRHCAEPVLDPTLTVENVTEVMGKVGDWKRVGIELRVPASKRVGSQSLGRYWVSTDPDASWKKFGHALYEADEGKAAAMVKQYLPKDPTLTVENVTEVMGVVGDWKRVGANLVPYSKRQDLNEQLSTEQEKSQSLGRYWVTDPDASWDKLAKVLYKAGEDTAAAMVKQYLPKDPTLTTDNLMEVLKGVEYRWWNLGLKLGVPQSKREEIRRHYRTNHLKVLAVVDNYVRQHPTASWKVVAMSLQEMDQHKQADEVTTKYVKASEKSKELFDEAMKDGYVEARDIKALIFGAAGTGKSHTIALIMDEEPPSVRRSTPCATRPIRATRAKKRGKRWVKVTRDELSQTIADTATTLPSKHSPSKNTDTSAASSTTSTASGTPRLQTGDPHTTAPGDSKPRTSSCHSAAHSSSSKESGHASSTPQTIESVCSPAEDELLRRIEMSSSGYWEKNTFKRDRITLIDTGGQPQFHEVLPIFMQGTSASMFTIKLSERLSDHPLIEYYDDNGNLVGTPYRSAYTNQQILRHCMRVIQAQASQSEEGICPNTIFIGTHNDLEKQCPESREEKNLKIREMLLPAVQEDAIYCGEEFKDLIFPLNVKNPGPQEKEFAAELRRVIVKRSHVKPKRIPLRWNALELALQKQMLELGRGVLSKAECLAVAERFHFDKESFEEALKYLHGLNVLFYYKDVLPDIVFCDPMVLLTKITELAEHSYRLRTDPKQHRVTEGKLRKFRSQGIVTLELLRRKEFASHYVPGVFGPEELLKLFKKLLIVSQISEEEYLMPCLLPVADDPALLSPSGSVPPLLLYFPHSALVGVFCALVAYLLSEAKWTLLFNPDDLSPVKVDRNTIIFQLPGGLPGRIILTDSFSTYFQVSLQLPRNAPASLCLKVCPQIRDTIMTGLRKASTTLHYSYSVPCDAFLCCEHSTTSPHATVIDSSRTLMTCSRNPGEICTILTEQYRVWFGSSGTSDATTSGAATQSSSSVHSPSGSQVITDSPQRGAVCSPPSPPTIQASTLDPLDATTSGAATQSTPNACSASGSQVITDSKPRMAQLMRLKTSKGEKVEIIKTIAADWKDVGFLMDLDPNGGKVNLIEKDHAHKRNGSVICCQEMFRLWLDSPDATWGNLIELLIDSEHKELAEQVKNALGL